MDTEDNSSLSGLVFLDTEVFVRSNFQYDRGLLAAFRQQIQAGRARHITTEITVDEIRARIHSAIENAHTSLRQVQNKARILRNLGSRHIIPSARGLNRKKAFNDLSRQFSDYLKETSTTVVQTDVVKPSVVFSRYFKAKPPFNQEKKKSEFPDAFALEALRTFCVENGSRVTIVSGDSDCKAACEEDDRLKYVEKLELLLQSLQENSALLAAAKDALTHLEQEIQKQIAEECRTLEFFVADSLATVTEVTDSQVHVQQRYIVDVTNTAIVFSIEAWIDFSVSVNYPSRPFTNGSGKWGIERLPRNRLATNVNNSEPLLCGESFSFVGTASWRAAEPDSAQLVNLSISDPHAVPVYYDDYTS